MSGAQNHSRAVTPPLRDQLRYSLHRLPLLPVAVAAAIGILIDSVAAVALGPDSAPVRGVCWIGFSLIVVVAILRGTPRSASICTLFVFVPMGGCWHALHHMKYERADLLALVSDARESAVVEGVVDRAVTLRRSPHLGAAMQPRQSPWQTRLELRLTRVRQGREMATCRGRVLVVVADRCDHFLPGDLIRVHGVMGAFSPPTNPGEDDRRYQYRQRNLHARIDSSDAGQLVLLPSRPPARDRLQRYVATIATHSRELLLRNMSDANGSLAVALVMGQREFVDEPTRDLLLVTGTAHLLSVSGLHLAIIVAIATWIAAIGRFPIPAKIAWVVGICVFYTMLTGARPPVVRASILIGTLMLALWMRRPFQPLNTLSLAALVILSVNPLLIFNMGVQLSFLAVTTLVLCGSRRQGSAAAEVAEVGTSERDARLAALAHNSRLPIVRALESIVGWLGQATWFSACVTLISTPLIWQHFHVVAPISVATNVILGPFLFAALGAGVTAVVAGNLWEPLMTLPAAVCDYSMTSIRWIIETAAAVPGGHYWLPSPPSWWILLFYLVIGAMLGLPRCRRTTGVRFSWIVVWLVMAWSMATSPSRFTEGNVEATLIDVGHGTSVVLRLSEDDVWLYDCGRLGNRTYSSRGVDSTLWSMGVTRLQGVFLSHADADHFNALPGILRRFDVETIYTPPGMLREPEPALDHVRDIIRAMRVPVVELCDRQIVTSSECEMLVVHPPKRRIQGSDNANSLVLRMDHAGTTLILPGDLEPPGTDRLLRTDRPPPGGVLMAPHHGSLRMDADAVLQWARPRATVVSGGRRAGRPEVHEMLAAHGSSVDVTSRVGAIRVAIDRSGEIEVRTWNQSPW